MSTRLVLEVAQQVVTVEHDGTIATVSQDSESVIIEHSTTVAVVAKPLETRLLVVGGSVVERGSGVSFESVSKNLSAFPSSMSYALDGTLEAVAYTTPDGTVTKTLGYSSGRLSTITLSGAIPSGIDTVKTLVYAGDSLASVSYS